MKSIVQSKIDHIKALSKRVVANKPLVKASAYKIDNLSKSIRTERDAEIFRSEFRIAINLANSK